MELLIIVISVVGALVTLAAGVRFLMLARQNAGRDVLLGWLAMIVVVPLMVFAIARVFG